MPLLIIAAALLAYANSFSGAFVFDDGHTIVENERVRQLWHGWHNLIRRNRWLVSMSFACNYAISGLERTGFHATNLAIHVLAGLFLYGIVRRSLTAPCLSQRYGQSSRWLAFAAAAIWVLHPLQTQSVTYITQRSESLMGLFYLMTLYCTIRSATAKRRAPWYVATLTVALLGTGCKETIVTVPIAVIIYDRIFMATSFRDAFRRRAALYLPMLGIWSFLALAAVLSGRLQTMSAGFNYQRTSPVWYALTQFEVITHYLRLSVVPWPLCLDYRWPTAVSIVDTMPYASIVLFLSLAAIWALVKVPRLGFLGFWFFLTLAPTSSILPIADNAVEHRMYLPLAGLATLFVIGVYETATAVARGHRKALTITRWGTALPLAVVISVFTVLTHYRNDDYRTAESIWADTVTKRPLNPRAHQNLGVEIAKAGRIEEAIPHFRKAIELVPDYADAHDSLGLALIETGNVELGLEHCRTSLALATEVNGRVRALFHIALGLEKQGKLDEAIQSYKAILELREPRPRRHDRAEAHCGIAEVSERNGEVNDVIRHYNEAIRILPSHAPAHLGLGVAMFGAGRTEKGLKHLMRAVELKPDYAIAHLHLGNALTQLGEFVQATDAYKRAVELQSDLAGQAFYGLGIGCLLRGQIDQAAGFLEKALEFDQSLDQAREALGNIRSRQKPE